MTEDRLEKALEAMRGEDVPAKEAAQAGDRVLEKFDLPPGSEAGLCRKFRLRFDDYLAGRLSDGSDEAFRLLLEDHLGRCPRCRRALAQRRSGHREITAVLPVRRRRPARWSAWAAAAVLLPAVFFMARGSLDTALVWGPRAAVESIEGQLFIFPEGNLKPGATLDENRIVRTGPASRAVLRLRDGSRVELNERTELAIHAGLSGKTVRLRNGDVIVEAAEQRRGHLRVETRDAVASVKGTVFAVSAGLAGSRVAVIEGAVAVERDGTETTLLPGQQSGTAISGGIGESFSWSSKEDEYFAMLASLSEIEKQLAVLPSQPPRTQSLLLEILPPGVVIYGAMPNIADTLANAETLMEQQAVENPAFGVWLESADGGQSLRRLLGGVRDVSWLLGDEIVFGLAEASGSAAGKTDKTMMPFALAQVQPDKRAELENRLAELGGENNMPLRYTMSDNLVSVSDSAEHLKHLNAALGEDASDPFIDAIRKRYARGVNWLFAVNAAAMANAGSDPDEENAVAASGVKYIFLEQRVSEETGETENELTAGFDGPRKGPASFLADSGSGGAAEYLPRDVVAAAYAATREPRQALDEMASFLSGRESSLSDGIRFPADLAAAFGTEYAFGIEGVSTSGPAWVFAALVSDQAALDDAVARMVADVNAGVTEQGFRGSGDRLIFTRESSDGRVWNSLRSSNSPESPKSILSAFSVTWTYDRGYMVAAASRGGVLRAISARSGGAALVRSSEFRQRLSVSLGLHPAGFVWFDTTGVPADVAKLTENPVLEKVLTEREPVLAVFTATQDEIRIAGRARISGIVMDLMLMGSGSR